MGSARTERCLQPLNDLSRESHLFQGLSAQQTETESYRKKSRGTLPHASQTSCTSPQRQEVESRLLMLSIAMTAASAFPTSIILIGIANSIMPGDVETDSCGLGVSSLNERPNLAYRFSRPAIQVSLTSSTLVFL
jgi:hypothetical protein